MKLIFIYMRLQIAVGTCNEMNFKGTRGKGKKKNQQSKWHAGAHMHINEPAINMDRTQCSKPQNFILLKASLEKASNGVALQQHWDELSCKDHNDCTVKRKSTEVSHTHHCKHRHVGRRWECPSQWGCPAMSLGMSALLCFYTHMETWMKPVSHAYMKCDLINHNGYSAVVHGIRMMGHIFMCVRGYTYTYIALKNVHFSLYTHISTHTHVHV